MTTFKPCNCYAPKLPNLLLPGHKIFQPQAISVVLNISSPCSQIDDGDKRAVPFSANAVHDVLPATFNSHCRASTCLIYLRPVQAVASCLV
jgi:hypothetical protein